MQFWFKKIYIGTLAENKKVEGDARLVVTYQGEILCTLSKDNVAVDIITGMAYGYLGKLDCQLMNHCCTYVKSTSEDFPKHLKSLILTRKALVRLTMELNNSWPKIEMPKEKTIVKRIK